MVATEEGLKQSSSDLIPYTTSVNQNANMSVEMYLKFWNQA